MLKSLVFCILLWHNVYEINGDPGPTDSTKQAEPKMVHNLRTARLKGPLLQRATLRSTRRSASEELITAYVLTKGIGFHRVPKGLKLKWNDARQFCIKEGGHFSIIRSTSEANIVKKLLNDASVESAWIGLHDQFAEGNWTSVLDEPLHEIGWEYWSPIFKPNPNNGGGNQNCAQILAKDGGMDDYQCYAAKPFVCKIWAS